MIQIQGEVAISVNGEIKNQEGLAKHEKLFDQMANSFVLTSRYQFKHTREATGSKFQTSKTTIKPKDRIISNKSLTSPPKKNSITIIAPVFAASTEQSSKGVTEEDMNQKFLKYFEAWMVETCKKKTMLAYAELEHDPSNFHPEITSKSQYVYIEGKKLAVISVSSHGGDKIVRGVKIIGFSAPGTLSTVACIRQSNHDIPIYTGVCGAKIKEVFGVGIPTQ